VVHGEPNDGQRSPVGTGAPSRSAGDTRRVGGHHSRRTRQPAPMRVVRQAEYPSTLPRGLLADKPKPLRCRRFGRFGIGKVRHRPIVTIHGFGRIVSEDRRRPTEALLPLYRYYTTNPRGCQAPLRKRNRRGVLTNAPKCGINRVWKSTSTKQQPETASGGSASMGCALAGRAQSDSRTN
jgi:hypothetical protein